MPFYRNFPGQRIFDMKKHFDRMYDDFMHGREDEEAGGGLYPAINLENTDKEYIVTIELPGINKTDVQITFQDGKLILYGDKKEDADVQKRDFLRYEREYGKFSRKISIDGKIKEDKISAEFRDGILEVKLQKEQKDKSKRVNINIK